MKRIAAAALVTVVVAVDASDQPMVYGIGTTSCGEWVQEHQKKSFVADLQTAWLLGYLSGVGATGYQIQETDLAAVEVWMGNYCQQNPLNPTWKGSLGLLRQLKR
jgi:hypothetical protein